MAHELTRIRSRMINTPFLADIATFEGVLEYLDRRSLGAESVVPALLEGEEEQEFFGRGTKMFSEQGLGIINISGPLTNKATGFEALCGGASYQAIKEDFLSLVDSGVKTVGFIVDSGGGEAYGAFDTGDYLRKVADESGIKIITYVDGVSASAAYALTAISDEVIVNSFSELGSIGVLVRLMNDSKRLEKEGIERTFLTAGDEKIPFNEEGGWREEFTKDLQIKVDKLYEEFIGYVAKHRNIPVESVRSTQAKTFFAQEAISLGLADQVMTLEEFYTYLSSKSYDNKNGRSMGIERFIKFSGKEETTDMELSQLQADLEQKEELLEEALTAVTQLTGSYEALKSEFETKESELKSVKEALAKVEGEKEEAKASLRKDKLTKVLPEGQVESVYSSLASLDDEAFETVLAGFAMQSKAVQESELMQEMGNTSFGEEGSDKEEELSTTDKLILERIQ